MIEKIMDLISSFALAGILGTLKDPAE